MKAEAFSPLVLPEVIGCPHPLLVQQVMITANHFCNETGVWDEVQPPILTTSGVADYEIYAPPRADMLRVRGVWLDNRPLDPERMARPVVHGQYPTGYHAALARGAITLNQQPAEGQQLVVRAVYAPKITSDDVPDFLMARHASAIASGAKYRLMAMPGQPWSNGPLAAYHRDQYDAAVVDARIDMERDNTVGSLRASPRFFK